MKTRQVLLAMVLGAFGCAYGAALQEVYKTPGYVWGIYDRNTESRMSKVPTTPTLLFPDEKVYVKYAPDNRVMVTVGDGLVIYIAGSGKSVH